MKIKASVIWWIFCFFIGIIGGLSAGWGIWIEVTEQAIEGLYMLILSPFLLVFAGIFATVAAKFESEGR